MYVYMYIYVCLYVFITTYSRHRARPPRAWRTGRLSSPGGSILYYVVEQYTIVYYSML